MICDYKSASHHLFQVLPGKVCKARSKATSGLALSDFKDLDFPRSLSNVSFIKLFFENIITKIIENYFDTQLF